MVLVNYFLIMIYDPIKITNSESDDESDEVSDCEDSWRVQEEQLKLFEKNSPKIEYFVNIEKEKCVKLIHLNETNFQKHRFQEFRHVNNREAYIFFNVDSYDRYDYTLSYDPYSHNEKDIGLFNDGYDRCYSAENGWTRIYNKNYPNRPKIFADGLHKF